MHTLPAELALRTERSFEQIPSTTFYRIAQLRQIVFAVEQNCPYLDLDGRDLEPATVQLWVEGPDGTIAAGLRILSEDHQEPGLRSIGRVVTAPNWRGKGIAAALLTAAIAECEGNPIVIHAQSYLTTWYERFGFTASGPEFLDDDIPHTPMRIG